MTTIAVKERLEMLKGATTEPGAFRTLLNPFFFLNDFAENEAFYDY